MNSLASLRTASRAARNAVNSLVSVRGYAAKEALETKPPAEGKLGLRFVVPHQTVFKSHEVDQVNLAAISGDMGILSHHIPVVEQLKPGVIEVITAKETKKWFVSGGHATMNADSTLNINAIEAYPLDSFSPEAIATNLEKAKRRESASSDEVARVEAKVEIEVLETISASLKA